MLRHIVAREPRQNQYSPPHWRQLELFPLPNKRRKPQISSIPGASPKQRNRYRVILEERILADNLTISEALDIVKRGEEEAGKISQIGRSPGETMRSAKTGKPVPCDRCAEVRVLQGRCVGCGIRRVTAPQDGLEAIGSILARLPFVQEGGEG